MSKEYIKNQERWLKENKVKEGDHFRITCIPIDFERGWGNSWLNGEMGKVGDIVIFCSVFDAGYGLTCRLSESRYDYGYPYFCLEKVYSGRKRPLTRDTITNIFETVDYMVDCTLASVEHMALKKRRPKGEYNRQKSIAQFGIDKMKEYQIEPSCSRVKEIIDNKITVNEWARKIEV